jgi:hypothetical protein
VLDPRLKLQYYKDQCWEDKFIQNARRQMTDLWNSTYKMNITEAEESSDDVDNDLFGHIFKKQKLDKDELNIYLNERVVLGKTDILVWWKVF